MKNTLVTSFAGLALVGSSAFGQLVTDNFDGYSAGAKTSVFGIYDTVTGTTGRTTSIVADFGNLFGAGTSNQVLELADTTATSGTSVIRDHNSAAIASGYQALVFSFDFVDTVGTGGDTLWTFRFGNATLLTEDRWDLQFNGAAGTINAGTLQAGGSAVPAYTQGVKNSISLVVNNSASDLAFQVGSVSGTVSSGRIAVMLNNTLVAANASGVGKGANLALGEDLTAFSWAFAAGSANPDSFYVDNLSVAAIPEPSAFAALAGVVGLGLAAGRRRARR